MTEPVVFISHFGIKEGKLDDLKCLTAEVIPQLREGKPRTVLYLAYLDEQAAEISFLHSFPDADSMDVHFEGVNERVTAAYQYIEPRGGSCTGSPTSRPWKGCDRRRQRPRSR